MLVIPNTSMSDNTTNTSDANNDTNDTSNRSNTNTNDTVNMWPCRTDIVFLSRYRPINMTIELANTLQSIESRFNDVN